MPCGKIKTKIGRNRYDSDAIVEIVQKSSEIAAEFFAPFQEITKEFKRRLDFQNGKAYNAQQRKKGVKELRYVRFCLLKSPLFLFGIVSYD